MEIVKKIGKMYLEKEWAYLGITVIDGCKAYAFDITPADAVELIYVLKDYLVALENEKSCAICIYNDSGEKCDQCKDKDMFKSLVEVR